MARLAKPDDLSTPLVDVPPILRRSTSDSETINVQPSLTRTNSAPEPRQSFGANAQNKMSLTPPSSTTTTPKANASMVNGTSDIADAGGDMKNDAGFGMCAVIALLACFMGATDGLSLGAVIFPSDADHPNTDFKNLGMSLGLLSALISNLVSLLFSDIRFSVGGAIIPMVAVMTTVFQRIGPSEPQTILAAVGLVSFLSGVLFYISGMNVGAKQIIALCPTVIFGGFLAGTGATLFDFGFQLLVPGFTSLVDFSSTGVAILFTLEGGRFIVAPSVFAAIVFLIDRWGLIKSPFLAKLSLPITLVFVTIAFYVVLGVMGVSLEEARAEGWLFPVEVPKSIDCYKVWTMRDLSQIRWDLIFTVDFAEGVLRSYAIGLLTLTKNIYGVKESFGLHEVDIDREIRVQGGICMLGGALGALPANIVMSFACTARKLGAPIGRSSFALWLLIWSTIFFVFGEFIIAVCPKMIPGIVLILLGLQFCSFWLYDLIGKVPTAEHLVVVAMTLVDMVLDAGSMIMMGLFCSFIILAYRLTRIKPCSKASSLGLGVDPGRLCGDVTLVRSDIVRSDVMRNCLTAHGGKVLLLFPRDLTFLTCSQLAEELVHRVAESHGETKIIVLMMQGLDIFGIHFVNMISELVGLAAKHDFQLVLGGIEEAPMQALQQYGISPSPVVMTRESCKSAVAFESRFMLMPSTEFRGKKRVYMAAVELCENLILNSYSSSFFDAEARTLSGAQVQNSDVATLSMAVQLANVKKDHPAHPVAMNIHRWLNRYDQAYSTQVLTSLIAYIEVKTYEKGEVIYSPEDVTLQDMAISRGPPSKIPPLVWLLSGEISHEWMGAKYDFSHFRDYERLHGVINDPESYPRFQGGIVTEREAELGMVVGPFSTLIGYQGAMPHAGRLVAEMPSKCALLRREAYDKLQRESLATAECLDIYLARKTFVSGCNPSTKFHM